MAKGSGSKMLYFVLYVLLLSELMVVITERDELEEKEHAVRDRMLASIAESYQKPIVLSANPKFLDYNVGSKENTEAVISLSVFGLVSDEEKSGVEFYLDVDGGKTPPGWPSGGINSKSGGSDNYKLTNDQGNGIFTATFTSEGEFKFSAYCQAKRIFPGYLPDYLLEDLQAIVGEKTEAKSNNETFTVSAKRQGGVQKKGLEIDF